MKKFSILETIGNTPVVDISILSPNPKVKIFGKLETQNPFGSVKDRVAKNLINDAIEQGVLSPGDTLIEASSGNTGIALASIARLHGHQTVIVAPENITPERKALLLAAGALLIETPASEGSNGSIAHVAELIEGNSDLINLGQYSNDANPLTHYENTGPEIWNDLPEVTHFVSGLGTSGTLMGVGRFLKEQNSAIRIVAVEPPTGETLEGLRTLADGFIPDIFTLWGGDAILDRRRVVRPDAAAFWARELNEKCGILAGPSTGSSLAAAVKAAEEIEEGTIALLICDSGTRYLSTGLFSDALADVSLSQWAYF